MKLSRSALQVAMTLAVGESAVELEHRDMHWGNVLVKPSEEEAVEFRLWGSRISVATAGIQVGRRSVVGLAWPLNLVL